MNKYFVKFFTLCIAVVLVLGSFSVSAQTNTVLNIDFENANQSECFERVDAAGDINSDRKVNASDMTLLKKMLLDIEQFTDKADVNNDTATDIRDLVCLKKVIINLKDVISNGIGVSSSKGLFLEGKVAYTNAFVSLLESEQYYQITYSYKTADANPIIVKFDGISENPVLFSNVASDNWVTVTKVFKTGSLTANKNNELFFSGNGYVDNIVIVKTDNYWSDSATNEQGGKDIF